MKTPNLELAEVSLSSTPEAELLNEAFWTLDAIVQLAVLDKDLATPPENAPQGARYIVADDGTGDWVGKDRRVAMMTPAGWIFATPRPGWRARVLDEGLDYEFAGSAWSNPPGGLLRTRQISGTSGALLADDNGLCVEMSNAAANTLTIPPNADVALPLYSTILVRQMGAGQTTLVPGDDVTIRSPASFSLASQYSLVSLHQRAIDEWCIEGGIAI
jgi:hypothetical protein